MIINQHLRPGYSTEAVLYNPVFLLRFEGSEGSTNFVDECGNSFVGQTGQEVIRRSKAISGCAGLDLSAQNSRIITDWPTTKSLAGIFTFDFEFSPISLSGFHLFHCLNDSYGYPILSFFIDNGELRWYTGIFGGSDTWVTVLANSGGNPIFYMGRNYSIRVSRDVNLFIRVWIDGVQVAKFFCAIDYTQPAGKFTIGGDRDAISGRLPIGAIDNFALGLFATPDGNYQRQRIRWVLP